MNNIPTHDRITLDMVKNIAAWQQTRPVQALSLSDALDLASYLAARAKSYMAHDELVGLALGDGVIMQHVKDGNKINAIKRLRALSNCGLKEAKDAIEDDRIWNTVNVDAQSVPDRY